MLQDPRIMNIILTTLIGENAKDHYVLTPCEWIDGRRSDMLYTPIASPTDALPPVIVEVQNVVDKYFIRRLIKYCGHIIDKYQVEPIALTICIHAARREIVDKLSDTPIAPYLKKLPCDSWAQSHFFLSETTLSNFLQPPLPPMVAVGYVLVKQQVSLIGLEHRDDPTVQMMCEIAKTALDHQIQHEVQTVDVLLDVCKHNRDHYKRMLEALDEDGHDQKRLRQYVNDGILYAETCILKYSTQGSSSLMPAPPDLPESVLPSRDRNASTNPLRRINAENRKTDLEWANDFVEDCKAKKTKMNWKMSFLPFFWAFCFLFCR
ncbi:hypothetical protein DM01DRAFT_1339457 [Hesseltinella vesiculosa]|uniref:Uncharacterized protein n=1 Tax=Hesseltinella vesiculosa TaxID=101127 RepID=A0A1X2G767_9FUNG|nr:hypothetical protein DM01DRAFT_1339457 [Hesseltinella vesiculosa]